MFDDDARWGNDVRRLERQLLKAGIEIKPKAAPRRRGRKDKQDIVENPTTRAESTAISKQIS